MVIFFYSSFLFSQRFSLDIIGFLCLLPFSFIYSFTFFSFLSNFEKNLLYTCFSKFWIWTTSIFFFSFLIFFYFFVFVLPDIEKVWVRMFLITLFMFSFIPCLGHYYFNSVHEKKLYLKIFFWFGFLFILSLN